MSVRVVVARFVIWQSKRKIRWVLLSVLSGTFLATNPVQAGVDFSCKNFASSDAAQALLDRDPSDPYNLDADGNGVACDGPEDTTTEDVESSGRLGATREDWEAKYGKPIELNEAVETTVNGKYAEYDAIGFSLVSVQLHENRVVAINAFSPRNNNEEWTPEKAHPMDWTITTAENLVRQFLPSDTEMVGKEVEGLNFIRSECSSQILETDLSLDHYRFVDKSPIFGGCSSTFYLNDEGRVSHLFITLADEGSLAPDSLTDAESEASDEITQQQLSAEELDYLLEVEPLLTATGGSLSQLSELMADPRVGESSWTDQMVGVILTWRLTYVEIQKLTPPASLEEIHLQLVEIFGLYDSASYDLAQGVDSLDAEVLEQALLKMARAKSLLEETNRLLDSFNDERGAP